MIKNQWKKSKYLGFDQTVLVSFAELHLGDGATISLSKRLCFFELELRVEGDNLSPLSKIIFKRIDEARGVIDEMGTLDDIDSVIMFIDGIIDGCASLEKEVEND